MGDQLDLLDYPNWPGFRARDTSKAAADAMAGKAPTLRDRVLRVICTYSPTADEAAEILDESILAIRPRVSELAKLGLDPRQRRSAQEHQRQSGNRMGGQ